VNQRYLDYYPKIAHLIVPGVSFEELVRQGVEHNQYPEAIGREEVWIEERLARHRNPGTSFLQRSDDERWVKVTEAKTPHGYTVGIRTDVTAVKRAQNAAEAADREKTEFLNNVTHELRTPLTVIFGRATFLQYEEKLPHARQVQTTLNAHPHSVEDAKSAFVDYQKFISEQSTRIVDSAQHMLRLVEDLLDWTQVERGQLELDMTTIHAGEFVAAVVNDLRQDALAKGLQLTYSSDGAAEIMADKIRLKQILYNLVSNAIKFTETGSVHLSVIHGHDATVFAVKDTGCGISNEDLESVFLRFHQVDGLMTRQHGGFGLGLAIANRVAKLHGGALTLESTVGEGSTFRLVLPRHDLETAMPQLA